MKHYALTLPLDDSLAQKIVNALNRGVSAGIVIPHNGPGDVTSGDVLEFDTADPELEQIIAVTQLTTEKFPVPVMGFPITGPEHLNRARAPGPKTERKSIWLLKIVRSLTRNFQSSFDGGNWILGVSPRLRSFALTESVAKHF